MTLTKWVRGRSVVYATPPAEIAYTVDDPRIEPVPTTGCWVWLTNVYADGYAKVRVGGRRVNAHRAAWIHHNGPIPEGLFVDHLCRLRSCVNPDHLRLATPKQNATENSISPLAANAKKKVCPKCGGPYSRFTNFRYNRETEVRRCVPCTKKATAIRGKRRPPRRMKG